MNISNFLMTLAVMDFTAINIVKNVIVIVMVLLAVAVTVVVLMQKGTSDNIGTISGDSETYMGKNKGTDRERVLKIITVALGAVMVVLSIVYFVLNALE